MYSKEQMREYRKRYRVAHRERMRIYRKLHRDKVLEANRKWMKNNPDKVKANNLKQHLKRLKPKRIRRDKKSKEELIKIHARQLVRTAIQTGKIKKFLCETCNSDRFVQAHHDDYSKPLEIRWLCKKHHNAWHRIAIPLMP